MALSVTQLYEVMAQLPDPIFILSEDGYYVEYIGGMEQQSYHDGNPLAGKQLADVLPPEMAMWVKAQVAESLASGQVRVVEYELSAAEVGGINAAVGPQGVQRFEGKIAPLPSLYDGKRAVAWVTRNITRQYELQQRLQRQSETDQLTGLYNRRFFFEHCQPLRTGEAGLLQMAEQIRAAVEALPADPVAITVSLGTTLVQPEEEINQALARADEWLYQAKRAGRNRVAHCPAR
ncbi:TPA: diguanylate cyclase domain-containing protein [Aeromonas veronii]|uniref:sensor domain-containing diguanylate cyclase n=1 Tax=Aeromonas veronii TaxID=654 RepID=UPI00301D051F